MYQTSRSHSLDVEIDGESCREPRNGTLRLSIRKQIFQQFCNVFKGLLSHSTLIKRASGHLIGSRIEMFSSTSTFFPECRISLLLWTS